MEDVNNREIGCRILYYLVNFSMNLKDSLKSVLKRKKFKQYKGMESEDLFLLFWSPNPQKVRLINELINLVPIQKKKTINNLPQGYAHGWLLWQSTCLSKQLLADCMSRRAHISGSQNQCSAALYWDDPFRPQMIGPGVDFKFQLSKSDSALGLAYSLKSQPYSIELKTSVAICWAGREKQSRDQVSWTDSSFFQYKVKGKNPVSGDSNSPARRATWHFKENMCFLCSWQTTDMIHLL